MSSPFWLSTLSTHSSEYRKASDIWIALIWSSLRSYWTEQGKLEIYEAIRSVRVEKDILLIQTKKWWLINLEIQHHQETLIDRINPLLARWGGQIRTIRVR